MKYTLVNERVEIHSDENGIFPYQLYEADGFWWAFHKNPVKQTIVGVDDPPSHLSTAMWVTTKNNYTRVLVIERNTHLDENGNRIAVSLNADIHLTYNATADAKHTCRAKNLRDGLYIADREHRCIHEFLAFQGSIGTHAKLIKLSRKKGISVQEVIRTILDEKLQ